MEGFAPEDQLSQYLHPGGGFQAVLHEVNGIAGFVNGAHAPYPELNNDVDDDCCAGSWMRNGKSHTKESPFTKEKLYPNCKSSKLEMALMLIYLMIHHNLSYNCMEDLLIFVDMLLMEAYHVPGSLYHLRQYFGQQYTFVRQYYCTACKLLIDKNASVCQTCNKTSTSDFVYFPIEKQIQVLFSRKSFRDMIFNRFDREKSVQNNIESIADGAIYKNCKPFLTKPNQFSLCYYSDGVQVFKSSNVSFWPIYLNFNEIPYKERFKIENMIFLGLWYKGKPDFNAFLKPSQKAFLDLMETGVDVECEEGGKNFTINVKGILLNGHGDSPARSLMLCMQQYNGHFGCLVCFQEAEHDAKSNTKVLLYKYKVEKPALRTSDVTYYKLATGPKPDGQDHNKGYKRLSILYSMMPKFIESMGVDAMHCIFMGVGKKMIQLWFSIEYKTEKFSMQKYLKTFDSYVAMIKKPNFITRAPRSIENCLSFFTTAELRDFVMYYLIPLLNQIKMPKTYLQHFSLLVEGVFLLNQNSISSSDIENAEKLLDTFVRLFEPYYGARFMSSNIHYLTHLAENVRRLGPLFETTCFPKESINGQIISRILGVNKPEMKVMEFITAVQCFPNFIESSFPNSDSNVQRFIDRIKSRNRARVIKCIDETVKILGINYCKESVVFENENILNIAYETSRRQRIENIKLFARLQINKSIFSSKIYTQAKSSISYCVEYGSRNEIGLIHLFVEERSCNCQGKCSCDCVYLAVIQKCDKVVIEGLNQLNPFVNKLHIHSNSYCVVKIKELKVMCVFLDLEGDVYYVKKVNNVDLE